jgi:glucose-6-phosphate 1-dehydrogenase
MGVTAALRPVDQSGRDKRLPDPCLFVVFGASGDLTKRKLLPALFHLTQAGLLPEEFAVVGVARRDLSETFVPDMKDGIVKGGGVVETDLRLGSFLDRVKYFQANFDDDDGFERPSTTLQNWMKSSGRVATGCSTWRWHPSILLTLSRDSAHTAW